jgi:hypothetical protein
MWTISGVADEIAADLQVQCETLNDLGIELWVGGRNLRPSGRG